MDMWDPNNWQHINAGHEWRVYADDYGVKYAIVDECDYQWAIQWRWKITQVCLVNRRMAYMCRTPSKWENGVRVSSSPIYLHVEIMKRTGIKPPSPLHKLVDHRFGKSLDCRRAELRWATQSLNNKNRHGSHALHLEI